MPASIENGYSFFPKKYHKGKFMSATDSNLSTIGYNLACAVTQDAINHTMGTYYENLNGKIDYYIVIDITTGTTSQMTSAQFASICSVDPKSIPDTTNFTLETATTSLDDNQKALLSLYEAGFQYGIQAVTGINSTWTKVPEIVELSVQGTMVTYNMYFASINVMEVQEKYGKVTMVNSTQAVDTPWIFSWLVNFDLASPAPGSEGVPIPEESFSIQQLYLLLNTLIDGVYPSISGVSPECTTFVTGLIDSYVKSIPAGQSTISYIQQPTGSVAPGTLALTCLNYEVSPNSSDRGLSVLNYLCMSDNNTPPTSTNYPTWQWVTSDETCSGVMAIERLTFTNYLIAAFNQGFGGLSIQTSCSQDIKDKAFDCSCKFNFSYQSAPDPATWIAADGTSKNVIATASYSHYSSNNQYDYSLNCSGICGSASSYWNYSLNGTLTCINNVDSAGIYDGTTTVSLALTIVSPAHAHLEGANSNANVVDIAASLDYIISVNEQGQLLVTNKNYVLTNNSQSLNSINVGACGGTESFGDVNNMNKNLQTILINALNSYENVVYEALSSSMTWFFPGASSFKFNNVEFSEFGDLTVQISYLDPTSSGAGNPSIVQPA
ncbi:hypothetical protein [Duganella qianjiadongensis]|uniref:Uncharacterized protein n=1 Tax=Duganella qianjiadongensis TaxID=2692176 RepID=A0ABW9VSU7_9BURK|nr:hypothetical protein [Duganella qianjiadongensis]MYM42140.1 hypothetical protein [Duganella qianjiadongensis]